MRGQPSTLHPASVQALAEVRERAAKAIVLLNRRGWSNFLSCRSCGAIWGCPECDVTLVLHRSERLLACHHCGHREPVPDRCPHCSSSAVARHGSGTERLAHDLAAVFDEGDFPVFRLDADAVLAGAEQAGDAGAAAILGSFQAASKGALIGTQMVAKGHDFPDVELALVIDADATLRFPDFRAEERTFALIAQLAGRAGRGGNGRVLVQTVTPEARAIAHAASHDSDGFLAGELERRRALGYPPFSHLVRIVCSSPQAPAALTAAQDLRGELERRLARDEGENAGCGGRARAGHAVPPARTRAPDARAEGRLQAGRRTRRRRERAGARRGTRARRRQLQRGRRPAVGWTATMASPQELRDREDEHEHDAVLATDSDVEVEREEGAPEPAELDPETKARRDAAMRIIRRFGDPVLRAGAVPVERFDERLQVELAHMGELMHDALGIGLAATQLGVLHRTLVFRTDPEEPITALVNPVLEWSSEELDVAEEGCLSLPGVHVEVERPVSVRVRALDAEGGS